MTTTNPPTASLDAESLASIEHTLRTMLRDRVPPLGNDETSIARHRAFVRSLEEALARLESGAYGRCVWCEKAIPLARLEVVPTAAGCQACTAKKRHLADSTTP